MGLLQQRLMRRGGLWDRKTGRPGGSADQARVADRRVAVPASEADVATDLVGKLAPARQPPAERFDKSLVALAPFGLRGRERGVGQRRRAGQPEAHEHRQRLVRDRDVALEPLHLPRHAIEPSRQRGLQPVGAIGRQMRGERRLDDQRLRHALAGGIVSELAGEIRRKAEGVLGAHGRHICMSSPGSSETWRATVPNVRCMMRWR